jgi:phage terminase large subunit-like protein
VTPRKRIAVLDFLKLVHWLDGSPILPRIEPYRRAILRDVLDTPDASGTGLRYNLALLGRAKKNAKSLDLVLAALFACVANDSPLGNEAYIVATDEGQARDDLQLAKKLVAASPQLAARLQVREKSLVRKDGRGFVMVLPGQDVAGSHGKSYRFCGLDEIHTQRT